MSSARSSKALCPRESLRESNSRRRFPYGVAEVRRLRSGAVGIVENSLGDTVVESNNVEGLSLQRLTKTSGKSNNKSNSRKPRAAIFRHNTDTTTWRVHSQYKHSTQYA